MAGSLLSALDLSELTTTLAEYEERAVPLATHTALLAEVQRRLNQGRQHSPLFDKPLFGKDFESTMDAVVLNSG